MTLTAKIYFKKKIFKQRVTDALNDRYNIFYQFFPLAGERNATPFCSPTQLNRLHLDYPESSNADAAWGVSHSLSINLKA